MSRQRPLILASASPRRRHLLKTLGIAFRVVVSASKELHDPALPPARLVRHNARLKADAVASRLRRGVVIAADTLVALRRGRRHLLFGKPRDARDAARMLRALSGRTHHVLTAVCIRDLDHQRRWMDVSVTDVTVRRLSAGQIARYLHHRIPWDKAGAYAVQDPEHMVIDRLRGSLSNVIGLPLDVVERRLRACGILPRHG